MNIINDFKLAIKDNTLVIREVADDMTGYNYRIHDNATDKDYSVNYLEWCEDMDIAIFELDAEGNEKKCLVHEHCYDPFGMTYGDTIYGAFTKFYKLIQA